MSFPVIFSFRIKKSMKCYSPLGHVSNREQNSGDRGGTFESPSSNEAASSEWRKWTMGLGVLAFKTPAKPVVKDLRRAES
jgi:hypothetical protein